MEGMIDIIIKEFQRNDQIWVKVFIHIPITTFKKSLVNMLLNALYPNNFKGTALDLIGLIQGRTGNLVVKKFELLRMFSKPKINKSTSDFIIS